MLLFGLFIVMLLFSWYLHDPHGSESIRPSVQSAEKAVLELRPPSDSSNIDRREQTECPDMLHVRFRINRRVLAGIDKLEVIMEEE